MRLGYVGTANAHEHSLAWWAKNRQDPDKALHLVRTWAWSPWLQECQQRLGHALHERTTLPNTWKELAIVRVCGRVDSRYELYHHVPLARASGLDDEVIAVALDHHMGDIDRVASTWRILLRLADALDDGARLTRAQWASVVDLMTLDQLLAYNAVVGYWRTNARLALACELDDEPWMNPSAGSITVHADAPWSLPPHVIPAPATDVGVREPKYHSDRALEWLGRSDQAVEPLVRVWAWLEDVQVANQRWWNCLKGPDVELPLDVRRSVALTACERVGSKHMAAIVSGVIPGTSVELDPDIRGFVDSWESAVPLDEGVAAGLVERLGRRQIVETQLILGFVGTQARLANLMGGSR